jgi:hypothetical protein
MNKTISRGRRLRRLVKRNYDFFKERYPEISERDLKVFIKARGCGGCKRRVLKVFEEDINRFSSVLTELLGESIVYIKGED